MRFVHYSANPNLSLERLYSVFQGAPFSRGTKFDKPDGLWLSDDDDYGWREWCEAEGYRIGKLKNAYLATLDLNSVLHISSIKQIVKFYNAFSIRNDEDYGTINWREVADNFKGIIISPYLPDVLWMYDYPFIWYASWDVACACIWDMSAIKSFERING